MALPPSIPTSFVPKMPVNTGVHKRGSGLNPFLALAYIILGLVTLAAAGVFAYQFYLEGVAKKKANDVAIAQQSIHQATVTEFIRLRDRFTTAKGILNQHIALSQFFNVLENLTLQGVTFKRLSITVHDDRATDITLGGTARSFNTLAAQSAAFASDKRIKRAIFSGITAADAAGGGGINFEVRAELDPTLVVEQALVNSPLPQAPAPSAPVATTSTATTTP